MRLPLPDGQWAEMRERLTYGQAKPIRQIYAVVDGLKMAPGEPSAIADLDIALVRGYVESWNVLDFNGNAVPLDQPELAPDDVIQEIAVRGLQLWKAAQEFPKAGRKRSASPPRELRSA